MTESEDLPPGWAWATPEDIASHEPHSLGIGPFGSDLKVSDYTDAGVPLVFVRNIRAEAFGVAGDKLISSEKAERLRAHRVAPGDVLITKMGEPPGDACLYPQSLPDAVMTADCIRIRLNDVLQEKKYFVYAIRSRAVRDQIVDLTTGVAQQKISLERFRTVRVPLAPLAEQARIVAVVDQHSSDIDAGVVALERALANLKRYRASVLKDACEGRLVPTEAELARKEKRDYEPADILLRRILKERRARWEADQLAKMKAKGQSPKDEKWKARYEEPERLHPEGLPLLPDGWSWATVSILSWDSGYGTSQKCDYEGAGPPVLRIPNIVGGRISLEDMKRSRIDEGFSESEALKTGDLIVIRTNGSRELIGRAGLVDRELPGPHFFASYLIRFRLTPEKLLPRWTSMVWSAPLTRQRVIAGAATSAGQYNVSLTSLARVPIPLPPLAEQHRIVAEVDRLLSTADETEQTLRAQLARAARLRQAVLKHAFEGKLVPQDPNDEPATALLARLRADPPPAPQRGPRTKKP